MYCIENYKSIEKLYIKKSDYSVLVGEDTIFLKEACEAIYSYFNEKKISNEKKLYITNSETGEKEKVSSVEVIYLEDNNLDIEIQLGSKTILYSRLLNFFKEKLPLEPSLITLNSILDDFSLDNVSEELQREFSKYSNNKIEFKFEEFTAADIVKKTIFNFYEGYEERKYEYISLMEKLKIKLSIFDILDENIEKIYLFYYPENNFSISEIRELSFF